jgi:hypothetical protein
MKTIVLMAECISLNSAYNLKGSNAVTTLGSGKKTKHLLTFPAFSKTINIKHSTFNVCYQVLAILE